MPKWLQSWWRQIYAPSRRPFRRLELERLEERTLLSGGATLALAPPLPPFSAFQTAHVSGFLGATNEVDLYALPQLNAGDQVKVAVTAQGEGSGLESALRIFDASGHQVAAATPDGGDPSLTFQAATGGAYFVGVSSAGNDTYSAILPGPSRLFGNTTGAYSLDVRLTPDAPLAADVTGGTFTLDPSSSLVAWSDPNNPVSISGSFTLQNRGGQDAAGFGVALVLSSNTVFDGSDPTVTTVPLVSQFSTDPTTPLNGDSSSVPISFTAALPQGPPPGFPTSGPIYVGLVITPGPNDTDTFDKSGVHRGEDWQTLTILTPVPAGVTDLSQADPALNTQTGGTIATAGQTDTYTFTVTPSQGSGQLTAQVTGTGGALAPRLTLQGPLPVAASPQPAKAGLLNGNGIAGLQFTDGGFVPPDSQGAAGPANFVETVNQAIALFAKDTGATQASDTLSDFWSLGGLPPVDSSGSFTDPVVAYDDNVPGQTPTTGRFIVCDVNQDPNSGASVVDIAVSTLADPTTLTPGDWYFYQINTTEAGLAADFPGNIGFNQDALFVTINQLNNQGSVDHVEVSAVAMQDLLADVTPDQLRVFQSDVNDQSLRPATEHDAKAGDPEWLVSETGDGLHINVYKMTDVLSAFPTFTLTQLAVNPYLDTSIVTPLQPDGTAVTTVTDSRIQKAAEADGTLVAVHAVGLSTTQDAAQWYMIDVSSGTPVLEQQGDVSLGDNTYASYPAIDINPSGAIGMTFMDSGTGAGQFLSMYVTGRLPGDPAGQMATPVAVPAGAGQQNYHDFAGGRAGDLSGINIDPTDGSFWAVNEFANQDAGGANWDTAIANFGVQPGLAATTVSLLDGNGFDGLHFIPQGVTPPDSQGAAGPANFVETVNQAIALFAKDTGAAQASDTLSHFLSLGGLPPVDSAGSFTDPAVTYDDNIPGLAPTDGRFIVTDMNVDPSGAAVLDLAVSTSADPTTLTPADWYFYQINTTEAGFATDFPGNLGFNQDALFVTLNQFDNFGPDVHVQVSAINIRDLVAGVPPDQLRFYQSDINDQNLRPATEHDAKPGDPEWLVSETGDGQHINVYKMTGVLSATPTFALTQLAVNPYIDTDLVPPLQTNGGAVTFTTDSGIQKAAEAGGTLVAAQAVALTVTQDAAQWYMIDVSSGTPVLEQQGDVSLGDNTYASYPAIDISPSGAVGMTFMDSGTGAGQFLSMYVTGRLPGDPAGQMAKPVLAPAGAGQKDLSDGRAGDLSGINVDPTDGTFWAVSEFAKVGTGKANWATAIANFGLTSQPPGGGTSAPGSLLIHSDDGSIVQHLLPGTYVLTVSARSGAGNYRLVSEFVQANPPLDPAGVGPNPSSIAVTDLTGAGIPDIVTTTDDNTVSVLLGNGDGTFQPARPFFAGGGPDGVAVADLTGDGKEDIVVADRSLYDPLTGTTGGGVTVLLGEGDGNFQEGQPVFLRYAAIAVAVADLNGDGIPDLVVAEGGHFNSSGKYVYGDTVAVLPGKGDGTFGPARTYDVGSDPRSVAVADLTGDGKPDIITANYGSDNVSVLTNTTARGSTVPTFAPNPQTYAVGQSPGVVAATDVNGDGLPDILVANFQGNNAQPGGLSVLFNATLAGQPTPTFHSRREFDTGFVPFSMTVGYLNHDDNPDVVVGNFGEHTVSVLLGDGAGAFAEPQAFPMGHYPGGGLAVADLTGDGNTDVVVVDSGSGSNPDNSVSVLLGNGDGTLQPLTIGAGAVPVSLALADVNGDGRPDAIVVNQQTNQLRVLLGNGDGSFRTGQILATGEAPDAVAVADLNNDGKPDIAVANEDGTLSVFLGNGDGSFQAGQVLNLPHFGPPNARDVGPQAVAVADVNGDGKPDLVVALSTGYSFRNTYYHGAGAVILLLGNGDGTFQAAQTFDVPNGVALSAQSLAVADINGDGRPDLVVVNNYFDTLSVLLNETVSGSANVHFDPPQAFFAGHYPTSVAVGNINGDGKPAQQALVVGHYIPPGSGFQYYQPSYPTNTVTVLLNTTPALSQTVSFKRKNLSAGTDPSSVAIDSVTGDGNPDIIAANFRDNSVTVLDGDGKGNFQIGQTVDTNLTPTSVSLADLTGDGRTDVVVGNEFGGSINVLLADSDGTLSQQGAQGGTETGNTPLLADLTGSMDTTGNPILDSVVLDNEGNILFRQGELGSDGLFAPPVVLNPGNPARDIAIVRTATGFAVAAADVAPHVATAGPTIYDVSLYAVRADGTPQTPTLAYGTTLLPTRIVAGDLNGDPNGFSEIVVADGLDNSIQVAFPQKDGSFAVENTLPTDNAPSAVTLVNDAVTPGLKDIVVTDLASGDVTVYLNDPANVGDPQSEFSVAGRLQFRTGISLYQLDQTGVVSSREQPVSVASGNFLGNGLNDLVVVNRGTHTFSVLANDGSGGYLDPQPDLTFSTSGLVTRLNNVAVPNPALTLNNEPGPVVAGYFNGPDQPEDLAILMEDTAQVWIYAGDGHGDFTFTGNAFDVGDSPTGLTVVPGSEPGTFDLLVGNSFGDILRLIGNGQGGFTPEVLNGTRVPLDVEQIGGHVQALVANQALNQVLVATRTDNGQFSETLVFNLPANVPFNPGDAHWFSTSGTPTPDNTDAVVVASGSNQVFVYHFDPGTQQLDPTPLPFSVGTDPTSVTVADLGNGAPDLIVTNAGSNDVSVIFGSIVNGQWVGTPGPRLNSQGIGPIATSVVRNAAGTVTDLAVFNGNGTVALLPSRGQGFFDDRASSVQVLQLPSTAINGVSIAGNVAFATTDAGGLVSLNLATGAGAVLLNDGSGVSTIEALAGDELLAAFDGGTVADLVVQSSGLVESTDLAALTALDGLLNPSSLGVLGDEVLATQAGSDQLFVFALESTSPVTTVTAADNLSLVVTILFNGETTNTNTATGADNGASLALTAEGIGSFLASLNLSQLVGGPEGDLASNQSTGTGNPIDAGIDLDGKLRGIDLYPNGDTDPDRTVISRRESAPVPVENRPAPRETILADVLNAWESLPAVMAPNAVTVPELTVTNRQPVESGGSQSDVIVETDSTASDTDATPPQAPIMPAESADGNDAAMPAVIPDAGMALDRTILASLAVAGWVHQIPAGERTADTRRTSPGRSRTRPSTLGP